MSDANDVDDINTLHAQARQLKLEVDQLLDENRKLKKINKELGGSLSADKHNDNCSICYEELEDSYKTTCNHIFHEKCINTWLKSNSTCPLCRANLKIPIVDLVLPPSIVRSVPPSSDHRLPGEYSYSGGQHLGMYSFSLYPGSYQPSGHINVSRVMHTLNN